VGEESIIPESREPNLVRKDFFDGSGAEMNDRDQGSAVSFSDVKKREDAYICCDGAPFALSSPYALDRYSTISGSRQPLV